MNDLRDRLNPTAGEIEAAREVRMECNTERPNEPLDVSDTGRRRSGETLRQNAMVAAA
jgi:hypothetical protein